MPQHRRLLSISEMIPGRSLKINRNCEAFISSLFGDAAKMRDDLPSGNTLFVVICILQIGI